MRAAIVSLLVVPLLVPSASLSAQVQQSIESGDRVRITSTEPRLVKSEGTCLGLSEGHLQFASSTTAGVWSIHLDSITALDVSRSHKSFGVFKGAGIGLLSGASLGVLAAYAAYEGHDWALPGIAYGAFGAWLGTLLGAMVGSMIVTERWQELPLDHFRLQPVARPDGRFGLAASVRF